MTRRADAMSSIRRRVARRGQCDVGVVEDTPARLCAATAARDGRPTRRAGAVQELLQAASTSSSTTSPPWSRAANEGELRVLPRRLNEEHLAWAFRPDDEALRAAADAALARWEADGSLRQVLDRWLPYWSKVE
jgi:ABC-type amino acid transport substrate-binding protein